MTMNGGGDGESEVFSVTPKKGNTYHRIVQLPIFIFIFIVTLSSFPLPPPSLFLLYIQPLLLPLSAIKTLALHHLFIIDTFQLNSSTTNN